MFGGGDFKYLGILDQWLGACFRDFLPANNNNMEKHPEAVETQSLFLSGLVQQAADRPSQSTHLPGARPVHLSAGLGAYRSNFAAESGSNQTV